MQRLLIPLGLCLALLGLLVCWPLLALLATHHRGQARVLAVLDLPAPDGMVGLRPLWELRVAPDRWVIGDAQRDALFRNIDDPQTSPERAAALRERLLPDSRGPGRPLTAFWSQADGSDAFVLDVTLTHPWRRYFAGAALACGGLVLLRLGLARREGA